MLRSLVGSEMCIRDSMRRVVDFPQPEGPTKTTNSPSPISRFNPLMTCTCLLYTSDAADDLLCVDLGGRRIIKKKNITTTNSYPTINHNTT